MGAVNLSGRAKGRIELRNVSFRYARGGDVLEGINLDLPPNITAALVGPTGVGKTTLVSLVPRFYDVTEGELLIDGHDVRDADKIIVLEGNSISQTGTHDELMAEDGLYRHLNQVQGEGRLELLRSKLLMS